MEKSVSHLVGTGIQTQTANIQIFGIRDYGAAFDLSEQEI